VFFLTGGGLAKKTHTTPAGFRQMVLWRTSASDSSDEEITRKEGQSEEKEVLCFETRWGWDSFSEGNA